MRSSIGTLFKLCLTILLASCSAGCGGGGSSSGGGGGGNSSAFVAGKWTVTLDSVGPAQIVEFDINLKQSGSTISSDSDNTVDNAICPGTHMDSSTGTVNGDDFTLIFSINSETINLTGTLDPDGKSISIVNDSFTSSSGGPCFGGEQGRFSAQFIPSATSSYTGTLQVTLVGAPGFGADVTTAMLTEDPSFKVSGSMTVTGDPCFSALSTSPSKPGAAIGSLTLFEMTDGANTVDFMGTINTALTTEIAEDAGSFSVTAGCTEESGVFTLNPASTAAAARVQAAPAFSPVLAERFKAIVAARH